MYIIWKLYYPAVMEHAVGTNKTLNLLCSKLKRQNELLSIENENLWNRYSHYLNPACSIEKKKKNYIFQMHFIGTSFQDLKGTNYHK